MSFEKSSKCVTFITPEYTDPSVNDKSPISDEYEITKLGQLTNSLIEASENPSPDQSQIETAIRDIVDTLNTTPPENPDGVIQLIQSACDKCGHTSPAFMDFLQRHDQQA